MLCKMTDIGLVELQEFRTFFVITCSQITKVIVGKLSRAVLSGDNGDKLEVSKLIKENYGIE